MTDPTDMGMDMNASLPMTNDEIVPIQDEVPDCDGIADAFCGAFAGDLDECCLTDCTPQIKTLLDCIVVKTTGEDRSYCEIPTCPTTAPEPTDAPATGATSSATSTVTRVVGAAASLLAIAML